jgi:N-acetylglucosamine-6-phosphate deacetylase
MKQTDKRKYCIQNGAVILPDATVEDGSVVIADGRIAHAGRKRKPPRGAEIVDARGGYIGPGLFEIHVHGAGPNSLDPPDESAFRAVADRMLARGILQFTPAMMPSEAMIAGIPALIEATGLARHIPGIHVEGPFVNPAKRGGIQERFVRAVDLRYLGRLQRMARGRIVLMTFAPELDGAERLPRAMRKLKILPCVGHSTATCERVGKVVGRSKVNCTHLFNAMSGLDHREPGVAAFALNYDNAWFELNPDGTHVHPELLRLAVRAKRRDRIVLISDAVVSAGEGGGDYAYMGRDVVATEDGVYYRRDGTLVGSRILLNQGVARLIRYTRIPVHDAVRMASLNPATLLGLARRKGSLEAGKDADVVVFQKNMEKTRAVFFEGTRLR